VIDWTSHLHAVTQSFLTCRTHLGLFWIKFWFCSYTHVFVHLADALDIIKVSAVKPLLDVVFYVLGWRMRNNMCDLFTAFWIEHVHVEDARCSVVPCCGWKRVFIYILDFTALLVGGCGRKQKYSQTYLACPQQPSPWS
jgi:hypothetical protein